MKNISNHKKFLLFNLPYIFYISLLLYWFYDTSTDDREINYIAMGVAMAVFVQLVFQNKIVGASLGVLGTVFSLFFLFSLLSEFNGSFSGYFLLSVGLVITFSSFVMGLILIITNLKDLASKRRKKT